MEKEKERERDRKKGKKRGKGGNLSNGPLFCGVDLFRTLLQSCFLKKGEKKKERQEKIIN